MPSFFQRLIIALSWRTLRRVHKDRRARSQLMWVFMLAGLVIYEVAVVWNGVQHERLASLIGYFASFLGVALVLVYRRFRPIEKSGPLTLNLVEHPAPEPIPEIQASPELLREFAELALLHAILGHRAASEGFLKHKQLPEGQAVATRQTHIRLLREHGMYERLGMTERDLILVPDGAWDEETIDRGSMLLEAVRVYRWLLGLDSTLPSIGEEELMDFRLAAALLEDTGRLINAKTLADIDAIRMSRTAAEKVFYRCYSEGLRRGFYNGVEEGHAEHAIFYAQRLEGRESEDLLLGGSIVSRATEDQVRLAASVALRRLRLLSWVQERLYGTLPAAEELTVFDWR